VAPACPARIGQLTRDEVDDLLLYDPGCRDWRLARIERDRLVWYAVGNTSESCVY
jgi:hypothetical protein